MRRVVTALFVISVVAGRAEAQSSAIAEQLFNEARELGKQGKWAEACPKFEASLKQDPALGTRLNLANCFERIGKLASAWGIYKASATLARKSNDTKRAAYADKQAQLLEPRLPKLSITPPATLPAGYTVLRDGAPVAAAEFGLALFVDPGEHEVSASAPGFLPSSQKVTVLEGKTETVVLPALAPAPEDPAQPEIPVATPVVADTTPVSPMRKYLGLGIGAGGLVAVGVGLVFGKQAMSANDDAKALCGAELQCSAENFDRGQQLVDDGRTKATISTVLVVTGGVAIAAGVVLFITAPRAKERSTSARIVPLIDSTGAGIGFAGSF